MEQTKSKTFTLDILNIEDANIENLVDSTLNSFLENDNVIYINHTAILNTLLNQGNNAPKSKKIILTVIYKDLTATPKSLNTASPKTKSSIKKASENNTSAIPIPNILTDFDKKVKK